MNYIRRGFDKLFTTSLECTPITTPPPPSLLGGKLLSLRMIRLAWTPQSRMLKSKEGLWALKAFKAPSPDGLHVGFFQKFWLIVGDSIRKEVKRVFNESKVPEYLNKTNIVLIPKITRPKSLGNYWPISLCNIVYKIVTKITVARLRPHLDKLVSPLQFAFFPSRTSVDNAIVVQELIHTISNKKGLGSIWLLKWTLKRLMIKSKGASSEKFLLMTTFLISWWTLLWVAYLQSPHLFSSTEVMWIPFFLLGELDKAICFRPVYSSSAWKSLDISLKKMQWKEMDSC